MQQITSFQNSKIKLASKLVSSKRHREKEGLFVVEYARDLQRALENGYQVEYAFYCADLATADDNALLPQLDETNIYQVDADLMAKASYRQNPNALVAVMQQKTVLTVADAHQNTAQQILALVDLRKPGNIGALLRTADAAGIQMICLIDSSLDMYNPNIIRASTGAIFLNNIYQMSREEALTFFEQEHVQVVAAHLSGEKSLYDLDFTTGRSVIVLGTEDTGLDDTWVQHCDQLVKIPMTGQVADSLNVSVSGAIFMYEALRQRGFS